MDWKKEAANDLAQHQRRKAALESLAGEIAALQAKVYGTRSPAADAVPVQGGSSTGEERLISALDELQRKREAYRLARRQVAAVERGLATLTDVQRDVLTRFYICRAPGHVQALAEAWGMEQSQVYRTKDAALRAFTLARYGVVEV